jgi:signal transduction histidine kinase/ActR/RegA family two-component response regulator
MVGRLQFSVVPMTFIANFVDRAPKVPIDMSVARVAERFAALPGTRVLAVAEGERVVGVIHRERAEQALSEGVRGDAATVMARDLKPVDGGMGLHDAFAALTTGAASALVVIEDGDCVGVATLHSLIDAVLMPAPGRATPDPLDDVRVADAVAQEFQRLAQTAQGEFRGQVHGLLAMAERLSRQHLGPDAQAQVRSIKATGEALLRLADDALDIMQARQGRLSLKPRPQLLRELADLVQDRWTTRAAEAGVGLLISYDGDPDLSASLDPDRMTQVFDNLIENALRYTRQGSVEVGLYARAEGEQVRLEGRVRDTGPGLAGAKLARIFDPDSEGGSLPLSLTRSIILGMKGSIRAESNVGQGMSIVFDMMADAAASVIAAPPIEAHAGFSAPHVLVVDDNATNRMVAEALCEMFDCTSETVEDGIEAVEAARSGRFDLILMDIKMPRMDGIAATKAIRALGGDVGATPIVALTANVDPEDARTYLAAGMCCVVEKPIKPDRLIQAINIALTVSPTDDAGVVAA